MEPGKHLAHYMGGESILAGERPEEPDLAKAYDRGGVDPEEPWESNYHGCPGGWYRTEFWISVSRYVRPCRQGVYSSNPFLRRCNDRLVIEAVRYFEREQARHSEWFERLAAQLMRPASS